MNPKSHITDRLAEKPRHAKSERPVTLHRPILPPAVLFSSTQGIVKVVKNILDIYNLEVNALSSRAPKFKQKHPE